MNLLKGYFYDKYPDNYNKESREFNKQNIPREV